MLSPLEFMYLEFAPSEIKDLRVFNYKVCLDAAISSIELSLSSI